MLLSWLPLEAALSFLNFSVYCYKLFKIRNQQTQRRLPSMDNHKLSKKKSPFGILVKHNVAKKLKIRNLAKLEVKVPSACL
jgi:hypothetical protein